MTAMSAKRVCVLGDGAWGTALALVAVRAGHTARVWSAFPEQAAAFAAARENTRFLPGVALPPEIEWTADRAGVADADLIVLAVPTKYVAQILPAFRDAIPANCPIVSVAKGLDRETHERMSVVAERLLRRPVVAALSGPSHAIEVAHDAPTAVTVASTDGAAAQAVQSILAEPRFRIYTSDDVVGVELGGALKNVIAVAVGVGDGLGFGSNSRAALITRGLAEMSRLGQALGARARTFSGLSGMGDLIVTCTSRLSRNHAVGERIGRGETVADILGSAHQAVEGVWNCAAARALALETGVDMPVTEEVYAMIHLGKNPRNAVDSLLSRDAKPE